MRDYEVLYILKPDLAAEATQAAVEKFSNLIQEHGGQVTKLDTWGKRRLAFEVNDFREGYYVLMQFKGQPETARELERVLKITEDAMKYLITRMEVNAS